MCLCSSSTSPSRKILSQAIVRPCANWWLGNVTTSDSVEILVLARTPLHWLASVRIPISFCGRRKGIHQQPGRTLGQFAAHLARLQPRFLGGARSAPVNRALVVANVAADLPRVPPACKQIPVLLPQHTSLRPSRGSRLQFFAFVPVPYWKNATSRRRRFLF